MQSAVSKFYKDRSSYKTGLGGCGGAGVRDPSRRGSLAIFSLHALPYHQSRKVRKTINYTGSALNVNEHIKCLLFVCCCLCVTDCHVCDYRTHWRTSKGDEGVPCLNVVIYL